MGEVLSFPGAGLPPEPEPDLPFEDWRDDAVADALTTFDALADAPDRESFNDVATELRARIDSWVGG